MSQDVTLNSLHGSEIIAHHKSPIYMYSLHDISCKLFTHAITDEPLSEGTFFIYLQFCQTVSFYGFSGRVGVKIELLFTYFLPVISQAL